ncbi:nucleotidyltransferase family protein [Planctobacterium marinum]|uniref:Xanthine dehydrogenase n=1 Tax=Planctobacterium marinum TaxID=1631968 RepID=A0AA48HYF0_9ALTE|nr:xanthine dehydrogenase [Planctobacterium marinum]
MNRDKKYQLGALLLAAGESRRFAGIKQLSSLDGKHMLQHSLSLLSRLECHTRLVTLGANANVIKAAIAVPENVDLLEVNNWHEGISASIRGGVEMLAQRSHILIMLADQPDIDLRDINLLLQQSRMHPETIVCAKYADKNAVPAIFPASDYALLRNLSGDKGAGQFLNHPDFSQRVLTVPMAHGEFDIDTQQDLSRWQQTKKDKA